MKVFYFIFILGNLMFVEACQPVPTVTAVPQYIDAFLAKHGLETLRIIANEEETRVLCIYTTGYTTPWIKYSVYDVTSQEEIYANETIAGSVDWHTNDEIAIKGESRTAPESVIIINVLTKETRRN